ncbi:hypothetical protein P3T23_000361 [Paraburkholderia sp. GAS448]
MAGYFLRQTARFFGGETGGDSWVVASGDQKKR